MKLIKINKKTEVNPNEIRNKYKKYIIKCEY